MEALENNVDLDQFFGRVARAAHRVLMLDYDGTLAPFVVARDEARPYPAVAAELRKITDQGRTRVVIISGRALDALVPLLAELAPLPELWGAHGWERRRADGRIERLTLPPAASDGLAAARAWVEDEGLADRCEFKPASVAVHLRGLDAPKRRAIEEKVLVRLEQLGPGGGLELHRFDGGLELRACGADKGRAVHTILSESPADAAMAYAGDDVTDEDAFRALGDRGLSVLVRAEDRPTAAQIRLRPPDELVDFLQQWHQRAGGA